MRIRMPTIILCVMVVAIVFMAGMPANAMAKGMMFEEWVKSYDGPGDNDNEYAIDIATDLSGNVYITGWVHGQPDPSDYLTIVYHPSGNELWTATYNGPGNFYDVSREIVVDSSGNVYVTGESWGIGSGLDFTTIAYDSSGNELWVARYNGPNNGRDIAWDIALDEVSGNVYVSGESEGIGTSQDWATVAYDSSGNQLWVARYDGLSHDWDNPWDITVTPSGDVIVVGDSDRGWANDEFTTVAYDSSGNMLWEAIYNGPANRVDVARAVTAHPSGNIYVTGYSTGPGTDYDYCTIAYDSSGNQLWVSRYNGPGNNLDIPVAIVVDSSENIYVTGYSDGGYAVGWDSATVAYDSLGNQLWVARYNGPDNDMDSSLDMAMDPDGIIFVSGCSYNNTTDFDCITLAYDTSGNQLSLMTYNDPYNLENYGEAIGVDPLGKIYVTGGSFKGGDDWDIDTIKYTFSTSEELIEDLIKDVHDLELPGGVIKGLINLLNNAYDAIEKGDYETAIDQLNAFINRIEALAKANKITDEEAAALIADANQIIESLSN